MDNKEQFKLFFEQNNIQIPNDFDNENVVYKLLYNLGELGTIEVEDIELEGEYISRLISLNPYTVAYINDVTKFWCSKTTKLVIIDMDNPL